jgi:hypothetical protein
MRLTTPVLTLLLFLAASVQALGQSQSVSRCQVGSKAAAFGFWTWAPRSEVKVYIVEPDFKSAELTALLVPIKNWNAVADVTGSQVKFKFEGTTTAPVYCQNCLTMMREPVFDKTKRHATELRAYSANRDQILTWAIIVVDPAVTNLGVLSNAIAHELGHNFGLLDCYNCKSKSTVMVKLKSLNTPNNMEGPTECDIAQVRLAYKELAVRVRPSPVKQETVDEGEEPIDDDTPIVVRKP